MEDSGPGGVPHFSMWGCQCPTNGGRSEVRQEQMVVPSQHEEDQTVLLPFPLFREGLGVRGNAWFELLLQSAPGASEKEFESPILVSGVEASMTNGQPFVTSLGPRRLRSISANRTSLGC